MRTVLVVDDDRALCRTLQIQLSAHGMEAQTASRIDAAVRIAGDWNPDLVLLDVHFPDADGLEALPKIMAASPESRVVIITGDPDNIIVSESMKAGAFDYLRKPLDLDSLTKLIERVAHLKDPEVAASSRREHLADAWTVSDIVGSHPKTIELHKKIGLLSRSRVTVLIEGESGTGKELAARILHAMAVPDAPFVAINCSAIVPTLLESELFGHERGAFTGADSRKTGKLEYAGEGTVFLDEISDMPLELQAKLLRVLQEEEFVRVGGLESIPLKARIIAATHEDMAEMVRQGRFREDLYYRLAVSRLEIPPLRERRQDLPLLVDKILTRVGRKLNRQVQGIESPAMTMLLKYSWPGNVRELENVMTSAIAFSNASVLGEEDFAPHLSGKALDAPDSICQASLAEAEKNHLANTLGQCSWNITRAAKMLVISPTTLRKKIADYGLTPERRVSDNP